MTDVPREVFVLETPDGIPVQSAIHEHRARPNRWQAVDGYRTVRYIPAESAKAEAQPAGTGWVSVADRLPPDDRIVLVWNAEWGQGSYAGTGRHVDDGSDAGSWHMEDDDDDPEPITHWMPLPPPPERDR